MKYLTNLVALLFPRPRTTVVATKVTRAGRKVPRGKATRADATKAMVAARAARILARTQARTAEVGKAAKAIKATRAIRVAKEVTAKATTKVAAKVGTAGEAVAVGAAATEVAVLVVGGSDLPVAPLIGEAASIAPSIAATMATTMEEAAGITLVPCGPAWAAECTA